MAAASSNNHMDQEEICTICRYPLSDSHSIQLTCTHQFHQSCLLQQFSSTPLNPLRRLLFNSIRCCLCTRICSHPEIDNLITPSTELLSRVDELCEHQIDVDNLEKPDSYNGTLLEYARSLYAFYKCSLCPDIYFGGTVECSTEADLERDDRMCRKCSPRTSKACRHPDEHGGEMHAWKCRFCCRPANFLCFANVHLCSACHAEDKGKGAHSISSKQCKCTDVIHKNGPGAECEFLLFCATCEGNDDADGAGPVDGRRGQNLIINGCGTDGMNGWTLKGRGPTAWAVESSAYPLNSQITKNFVSSHEFVAMAQSITMPVISNALLEVSARYMARTDCPSVLKLELVWYDAQLNKVGGWESEELDCPMDYWAKVCKRMVIEPSVKHVVVVVWGQDARFWAGRYGSKVTDIRATLILPQDGTVDVDVGLSDQMVVRRHLVVDAHVDRIVGGGREDYIDGAGPVDGRRGQNLIINGCGTDGMHGWTLKGRGPTAWAVESSAYPLNSQTTKNFVSSHEFVAMAQSITMPVISNALLEVSARYMARTDCPSVLKLELVWYDAQLNKVGGWESEELDCPVDYWAKVCKRMVVEPSVKHVVVVVWGQDARFWAGRYGSKVTDIRATLILPQDGNVDVDVGLSDQMVARRHLEVEGGGDEI